MVALNVVAYLPSSNELLNGEEATADARLLLDGELKLELTIAQL